MEKEPQSTLQDELRRAIVEQEIDKHEEWRGLETSEQERVLDKITEAQITAYINETDERARGVEALDDVRDNWRFLSWWNELSAKERRSKAVKDLLEKHLNQAFYKKMRNRPATLAEKQLLAHVFGPPELDDMYNAVERSREAVESEFAHTENSWLSCLNSRIFQIETLLSTKKIKEFFSPEKFRRVNEKLEMLKLTIQELTTEYPTKEKSPPEKMRDNLLERLEAVLK